MPGAVRIASSSTLSPEMTGNCSLEVNKLNPFLLIGKIPAVKRKFEEQGTSQVEVVNKVWGDKRYGFGIMLSGGALAIIIFLVILSASLIVKSLLNYPVKLSWLPFALCMALAYGVCHFMVFQ